MTAQKHSHILYRSGVNSQSVDDLLRLSEERIHNLKQKKVWRKRMFFLTVECVQNICRHAAPEDECPQEPCSFFLIGKDNSHFFIKSENLISNKKVDELKDRIEYVNNLDDEGLHKFREEMILQEEECEGGGANLGLIEMVRKSGGKIESDFRPADGNYSFFTFKLNVTAQC